MITRRVSLPCMPGHYCLHGKKMLCNPNTYGDLHNHTSQTCSGTCAYLYQSNESRTKCVIDPVKVILVACLLCFVMLGGVCFLRRRFKKNKARVKSLQDELQNANVLQKRTSDKLKQADKKVKRLLALTKPSNEQESVFKEFRQILKGSN